MPLTVLTQHVVASFSLLFSASVLTAASVTPSVHLAHILVIENLIGSGHTWGLDKNTASPWIACLTAGAVGEGVPWKFWWVS